MQVRALRGSERQRARSGSIAATANHATKAIGRVKRSIDTFSRSGDVSRFSVEDAIGAMWEIPESGTGKSGRRSTQAAAWAHPYRCTTTLSTMLKTPGGNAPIATGWNGFQQIESSPLLL